MMQNEMMKIPFGEYQGVSIAEVACTDPHYLYWLAACTDFGKWYYHIIVLAVLRAANAVPSDGMFRIDSSTRLGSTTIYTSFAAYWRAGHKIEQWLPERDWHSAITFTYDLGTESRAEMLCHCIRRHDPGTWAEVAQDGNKVITDLLPRVVESMIRLVGSKLPLEKKTESLFSRSEIARARKVMRRFCNGLSTSPNDNPKIRKTNGMLFTHPNANPKFAKTRKINVRTAPLHLAPYNTSGHQVCPAASKGCAAACLATAGNPIFLENKKKARLNRTRFFFTERDDFMITLYAELRVHENRAHKQDEVSGCRLNATSDISWEKIKLPKTELSIISAFPETIFYDYTKREKRMMSFLRGEMPSNYYLTFSASEDNWGACLRILNAGGTATVVFDIGPNKPMITEYEGWPVIDGDEHDFRPNDPPGHIIGLRAKGDALKDKSGFVHRAI